MQCTELCGRKVQRLGRGCGIWLHEAECQGSGSGNLLPYTGFSLAPHVLCQTVAGLMVSFPATWHLVSSQVFAYACAQLPCVQCFHRTPCYLLIEVLTSAASIKGGPECLGDVNEHTLHCQAREASAVAQVEWLTLGKAQELQ